MNAAAYSAGRVCYPDLTAAAFGADRESAHVLERAWWPGRVDDPPPAREQRRRSGRTSGRLFGADTPPPTQREYLPVEGPR